jgi:CRP/FNR family cyclic AMP-dependent transcriptional regulator
MPGRIAVAHLHGNRRERLHSLQDREVTDCAVAPRAEHGISELFITHLLTRNTRFDEDLVDQLFNSSEKRLARILLLLAHFGRDSRTETVYPGINQEHLAQMVGTTCSRVSHFMNRFRTLGFIDYAGSGALTVNSGLSSVIPRD